MSTVRLIYCGRSDGKFMVKNEPNAPTPTQLSKTKNKDGSTSYYVPLPLEDPKSLEWRKKLGLLLMTYSEKHRRAAGTSNNSIQFSNKEMYILADFPERYRLFEHRRDPAPGAPTNPKQKESPTFLYGHPEGRRKRFKTPADFFQHLYWLEVLDTSTSRLDCGCKSCLPDEVLKIADELRMMQMNKRKLNVDAPSVPQTTQSVGNPTAAQAAAAVSRLQGGHVGDKAAAASANMNGTQARVAGSNSTPTNTQMAALPNPQATPSPEQVKDLAVGQCLYRLGELVWYTKGTSEEAAVALAIVKQRDVERIGHESHPRYVLQPLSWPEDPLAEVIVDQEDTMKPWLAYTAPATMYPGLKNTKLTFAEVDWPGAERGIYGSGGNTTIDATVMAAKEIDACFTPIETLSRNNLESSYRGIYIGGEKVWLGDPLRIKRGDGGKDVLIVKAIVEVAAGAATRAHVVGDIYSPAQEPYNPNRQRPKNTALPARMNDDLAFRNRYSVQIRKTVNYWRQVSSQERLSLSDIKGRWYESRLLLPTLDPPAYQKALETGNMHDIGDWINSRGEGKDPDAIHGVKVEPREKAFGRAVPDGTVIGRGSERVAVENDFMELE